MAPSVAGVRWAAFFCFAMQWPSHYVSREHRAPGGSLAERLGWTKSKYAAVETGERRLDVVEFKHVAKALKLDPVDLFRRFANW